MSRKPRLHVPGCMYCLKLRGNNRKLLFFSHLDRLHFESLVAGRIAGEGASLLRYDQSRAIGGRLIFSILNAGHFFGSAGDSK